MIGMRPLTWVWLAAAGALGASFVISREASEHGPVLCPVRLITGLPCPGCGLVRAFVACAHGALDEAFAFNLFGPLAFVVVALFVVWYGAELALRRPLGFEVVVSRTRVVWLALAAIWIAWGLVRLVRHAA